MILRLRDEHHFFFQAGDLYLFYIFTALVISFRYVLWNKKELI